MMKKGLLIATIVLQLLLALTLTGWPHNVAELSAFLLVIVFAWNAKQPSGSATNSETSSI
ncbi:hypothetical protein RAX51_000378 [Vibrio fluvialis]|nr:hypothetical protein [Vibrio fluvialis]